MSDTNIKAFMSAAADLLQSALDTAKADTPSEYSALVAIVEAGGFVRIGATIAPKTGLARLGIDVLSPAGEAHRLMSMTLEPEVLQ